MHAQHTTRLNYEKNILNTSSDDNRSNSSARKKQI